MDNEWKLVPVEWTQEMLDACIPFIRSGKEYHKGRYIYNWHMAPGVGSAVIAAAPQPPSVGDAAVKRFAVDVQGRECVDCVRASDYDAIAVQLTARDQQIADLNDDFTLLSEDLEHTKRNCSAFEDRMGDYQVKNGKLRDELTAAQARIQQLGEALLDIKHINETGRTWSGMEYRFTGLNSMCQAKVDAKIDAALAQQVNTDGE